MLRGCGESSPSVGWVMSVVDQRTQVLPGVILFSRALGSADRLTIADLKVFVWIRHLRSGALDHIPADLPDRIAPKLVEHYQRVNSDPRIQAYYAKHGLAG